MSDTKWKLPRPPIGRLCTITWTCPTEPEYGKGIYRIEGYEDMGKPGEMLLVRSLVTNKTEKVTRYQADNKGLVVWRKDLIDPEFQEKPPRCAHIRFIAAYPGDSPSAKCAECGHKPGQWFCPCSPNGLCDYREYGEDHCSYCGEPDERK